MTEDDILAASESPADLESMYRSDPEQFAAVFPAAWAKHPTSLVLAVWHERLMPSAETADLRPSNNHQALSLTVLLSLAAGTLVKLPAFTPIDDDWYYFRFGAPITLAALMAYFLIRHPTSPGLAKIIAGLSAVCFVFLALLPDLDSGTTVLSLMHMPLVLWTMLGLAVCGSEWRSVHRRIDYIRYWGEIIVYSAVILLGGIVLSFLTFALFSLIGLDIQAWYTSYIVVCGIVASPIVATYLYDATDLRATRIAPMLANVFSPLFLATVVVYLVAMTIQQKSPFSDRDFLISLNGLLLLVLAISIFSVSERQSFGRRNLIDITNMLLIVVTIVIDVIALSAIVFRLSSMGITPNRLAVLGTNLLVFIQLCGLLKRYIVAVRNRSGREPLDAWIGGYLPLYCGWVGFVAFAFPFIFRFR